MTETVFHKLANVDGGKHLTDLLGSLMGHHRRPLTAADANRLAEICGVEIGPANLNHLLEITSTLAVVHGLIRCGWQKAGDDAIIQSGRPRDWYYSRFALRDSISGWAVEIGKKRGANEVAKPHNGDGTRTTRQHLFGNRVGAWQPDIRMQFFGPSGQKFWIVGDAKRSTGTDYPRVTGFPALMKYMVAFAHKIGWSVNTDGTIQQNMVNGIPMPAGLLFCLSGIEKNQKPPMKFVEGFNIEDIGSFDGKGEGRLFLVLNAISTALRGVTFK
jgi:hypothetical protein